MAGASSSEYDELDALDFAFKKYRATFRAKKEPQQAIFAAVTGKDVFVKATTGFGKSICYFSVSVPYVCDYLYSCQRDATNLIRFCCL